MASPAFSLIMPCCRIKRSHTRFSTDAKRPRAAVRGPFIFTSDFKRLASTDAPDDLRTTTYDGRSITIGETRPDAGTLSTGYDGLGQLTSCDRSAAQSLTSPYNGFDERVASAMPTHAPVRQDRGVLRL